MSKLLKEQRSFSQKLDLLEEAYLEVPPTLMSQFLSCPIHRGNDCLTPVFASSAKLLLQDSMLCCDVHDH